MLGSIFKLLSKAVNKVKEELKQDTPSTQPEKNEGVFDTVVTPNVDEFQPTETTTTPPSTAAPEATEAPETTQAPVEENKPMYDDEGYDVNGYNAEGYDRQGYNKDGYDKNGYDIFGYNKEGFDKDGFDKEGYNKQGYDKDGYNKQGYNVDGYNRQGYDKNGYNRQGYDKDGYDKNGYNKEGYDKNGYDKDGYDVFGYDKNGYDKDGYNKDGYDKDGYDKDGYDKDGVNKNGIGEDGYDENGYKVTLDENGNIISKTLETFTSDGKIKSITTINADGSKTEKSYDYTSKNIVYESVYNYDKDGKVLDYTYNHQDKNGNVTFATTTKYTYSSNGELQSYRITKTQNGTTTYTDYNAKGERTGGNDPIPDVSNSTKANLVYKNLPLSSSMASLVSSLYGEDTAGMLDLAGNKNTDYKKNITKTFSSYEEASINGKDYSSYYAQKLHSQLDKNYGYDVKQVEGYYFDSNSAPSKRIAQDEAFVNYLKTNKDKLENVSPDNPMAVEFKSSDNENLYYAFHYAEIIDSWVDDEGYTHIILADTYDFNNESGGLVQAGYKAMKEGKINPYFTMHEIKVKL